MTLYEGVQLGLGLFAIGFSWDGPRRFRQPEIAAAMLIWLYMVHASPLFDPVWMVPAMLVSVALSTWLALGAKTRAGNILALTFVAHLPVYAAYSLGLIGLDAVQIVSSVLLNVQIMALYAGIIGGGMDVGGTVVPVGTGGDRRDGRSVVASETVRDIPQHDS